MRLIDADAMKQKTEAHGERIAYVVSFLWDIEDAPTIDAIPVEWLKGKENGKDDLFGMCESVRLMWNRETKTLNKGKAGIWQPLGHIIGFINHPDSEYYKCSLCGYEQYTLYQQPPDTCPACLASMTIGVTTEKAEQEIPADIAEKLGIKPKEG